MPVPKVIILGGGFAGLAAARVLGRRRYLAVTLIDRKATSDFLPLLPDMAGGHITPEAGAISLAEMGRRFGFEFVPDSIENLDPAANRADGRAASYAFDYAIIASGSQTAFYGNTSARECALALDDLRDARRLQAAADAASVRTVLVIGGGYTGVEIATQLRQRFLRQGRRIPIALVERGPAILSALPGWMREYAIDNLARMDITVMPQCQVAEARPDRVVLSNGQSFESPLLVWAAGVETPGYVRNLAVPKTAQGRLEVDDCLRVDERVFSAGDTTAWSRDGIPPLRMSVQFALAQGGLAAENILRSIRGERLEAYRPLDLGYIVPMGNLGSCGSVLGRDVRGLPASLLHYVMCAYRSWGLRNKRLVLQSLLRRPA